METMNLCQCSWKSQFKKVTWTNEVRGVEGNFKFSLTLWNSVDIGASSRGGCSGRGGGSARRTASAF